ncbi:MULTISPECIES: hypothetical protein [Asticcacaulis]|uniref:hypothetical protein n=1 Tax=Asticcacaulis TaxID=76890 RepID=UPI001AE87BBF|nr:MULTISPECIES: hypothetical protein [Asticcacaulis]MBP2161721.1 hypothetical protein [Asticcacaulis solisilvae]MDR6802767.1 hypothetical protein [Asticcacaulis sp. BE141]
MTVAEALENIYTSLANDNAEIDTHIKALKDALAAEGLKEAVVQPTRLAQNNRAGRKTMQSYFRKRGVTVTFSED